MRFSVGVKASYYALIENSAEKNGFKTSEIADSNDGTNLAKAVFNFTLLAFLADFLILNGSYITVYFIKQGDLTIESRYLNLLIHLNIVWFVVSLFIKKYQLKLYANYKEGFWFLSRAVFSVLYLCAISMVVLEVYSFSRIQFFGSFMLYYLLSLAAFSGFYITYGHKLIKRLNGSLDKSVKPRRISLLRAFFDFVTLNAAFMVVYYWKHGSFSISTEYEKILIILYGIWFITAIFTRKFERRQYKNIYYALTPFIKAFLVMFSLTAVIMLAFRLLEYSRLQIFGSLVLFVLLEVVLYYVYKISGLRDGSDIESLDDVKEQLKQESLPLSNLSIDQKKPDIDPVYTHLRDRYLKEFPGLFDFISAHIDLNLIDQSETAVVSTKTRFNIQTIEDHTLSLFINLHKINDFRWLNRYFLEVHQKIYNGGYFVGQAHTISTHKKWLYSKFPFLIAHFVYPLDFLFRRIMPKLPVFKKIYFMITRGRNRLISKAETLGRLYFCGFEVVAAEDIGNRMFYIARRVKSPSLDTNPSYGLLIRLRRIGLDNKVIRILKFRTMHPYSEYLQQYIYKNYNLQKSGKFNNDFRITEWGKLVRKLWIDELPQFINFFQGDVSLVGVRALSQHYFDLYPDDLKSLRTQFKPGLVPPYYADMPKSFEEIMESERRYLKAKQNAPFSTDVKYFFKAMFNILFRKARSH